MTLQLFPEHFLKRENCFGLIQGEDGEPDLPFTIEGSADIPFHIVHSNSDHLAYLVGLIVLQAWTSGITESGIPDRARRLLLVVTDRPGRFGEAYVRLHLPLEKIKALFARRRVTFFEKTGSTPEGTNDTPSYLDTHLRQGDVRTRLHNFFPAFQVLHADAKPHMIASRQHLGRGDDAGPAVLITRKTDDSTLVVLQKNYLPLLTIIDANDVRAPDSGFATPVIFYHKSIFAPELTRLDTGHVVPRCLPDARFERFCVEANVVFMEPLESDDLSKAWKDVDGALQALIERVEQRKDRVIVEVYRSALRLRNLLLSLPVGIEAYEQALVASGQPESLRYNWSVSEPLQALESRLHEMAAVGEWEKLILQELIEGFGRLVDLLRHDSPKKELLQAAVTCSLAQSRRTVLLANNPVIAGGLKWAARLVMGLGSDDVVAKTPEDMRSPEPNHDYIIHQVFDPHDVFSALARVGARQITFILLRNELRFAAERLLRSSRLFPDHPAKETILRPILEQVNRIEPASKVTANDRMSTLFSEPDFEMVMRMFNQEPSTAEHGIVLVDGSDESQRDQSMEIPAYLIKLEDKNAVFLEKESRVSYVRPDDTIKTGLVDSLEPGYRLIIINPAARESIAYRILNAKRGEETNHVETQIIKQWQTELSQGINRLGLTHGEVLSKIKAFGSHRISQVVIGQWARGDVLGPLDAEDIRRIGEAIGSNWLVENWRRVALALLIMRSGHRLLGKQITRIIQKAAVGDYELARYDEEFLQQIGLTKGELQDAVTLLTIELVSSETRIIPADQIGKVISV